jgi:hypothetical protein
MRLQPKYKIILNMLRYGTVLGGLAGALSMVTLVLSSSTFQFMSNILPVMVIEILSIIAFGLIFGGVFGMMAGIYGGVGMAFMTSIFYTDIPSRNGYKIAMGSITAICTTLFLMTQLWHLRLDGMSMLSWNITMVALVGLAIYASQRVSSAYLFEWSLRKQKAYI